jgi:hypothetical protein
MAGKNQSTVKRLQMKPLKHGIFNDEFCLVFQDVFGDQGQSIYATSPNALTSTRLSPSRVLSG